MDWFKRIKEGITTQTHQKKETPDGLWNKCPKCKKIVSAEEFKLSLSVCQHFNYHSRIGSVEYFDILFDNNSVSILFNLVKILEYRDCITLLICKVHRYIHFHFYYLLLPQMLLSGIGDHSLKKTQTY